MILGGIKMKKNNIRFQFEFTEEKFKDLESLMKDGNVKKKNELMSIALSFLEWAGRETRKGRIIASVDEKSDKYKEVCIPILENLKP